MAFTISPATSGNMDGINLWRSPDLNNFEFVKQVWTPFRRSQGVV